MLTSQLALPLASYNKYSCKYDRKASVCVGARALAQAVSPAILFRQWCVFAILPFKGTMGTSGGNGVARATPCWCFWRPQVGLPDGARAPNPAELGARALAVVEFVCLAKPH